MARGGKKSRSEALDSERRAARMPSSWSKNAASPEMWPVVTNPDTRCAGKATCTWAFYVDRMRVKFVNHACVTHREAA